MEEDLDFQVAVSSSIRENEDLWRDYQKQVETLNSLLRRNGRTLVTPSPVRHDGNCLFDCLSLARRDVIDSDGCTRKEIVNHLRTHPEILEGFGTEDDPYFVDFDQVRETT
jgi:hypothetical protein